MAHKTKNRQRKKRTDGPAANRFYFIRRASHVDDSQWVNDEGRRIAFEKVTHASWFMRMFDADQKASITRGPLQEGDVAFIEVWPQWLTDEVEPVEYLAAIERTMADVATGGGPSRRAVRAFLRRQRNRASQ